METGGALRVFDAEGLALVVEGLVEEGLVEEVFFETAFGEATLDNTDVVRDHSFHCIASAES